MTEDALLPRWALTVTAMARPFGTYACSFAIAVACFGANAAIAIPIAGAVVGGVSWLRSNDKKVDADREKKDATP